MADTTGPSRRSLLVRNIVLAVAALAPSVGSLILAARLSHESVSWSGAIWMVAVLFLTIPALLGFVAFQRRATLRLCDRFRADEPDGVAVGLMRLDAFTRPLDAFGITLYKFLCVTAGRGGISFVSDDETVTFGWDEVVGVRAEVLQGANRTWSGLTIRLRRDGEEAAVSGPVFESVSRTLDMTQVSRLSERLMSVRPERERPAA
jgi:hypothetical protein